MRTNEPLRASTRVAGWLLAAAVIACAAVGWALLAGPVAAIPATAEPASHATAQDRTRAFTVVARRYDFSPERIEVAEGDVVTITLKAADIAHSFTVDHPYRISKRSTPGHPVVFEFRADRAGTFAFYCNLALDDRCREMRGTLVVTPRSPRP